MIIFLRKNASEAETRDLEQRIRSAGLDASTSEGRDRNVLLIMGDTRDQSLEQDLQGHDAVQKIVPILPQRRYERLFSRRSFLDVCLATAAGFVVVLGGLITALFLGRSGEERRQRSVFRVGSVEDFERRSTRLVDHDGRPIIVVRSASGEYHALSAICTHSEICQVEWSVNRQELRCPCHRAGFDLFGNVLHGPPPKPLRVYPVEVIRGSVYLKVHA